MNPNNSFLNSGSFQLYKLVVAMMFSFPTAPIMILVGGFVGSKLAFNPEFSTLPIALVVIRHLANYRHNQLMKAENIT